MRASYQATTPNSSKRWIITCPHCGTRMPWAPQSRAVEVICPAREVTAVKTNGDEQLAVAMYKAPRRARPPYHWTETYLVDGRMRPPSWYCGRIFRVRRSNDKQLDDSNRQDAQASG